ncbi:MAG: hypothetical protein KDH94_00795 [Coxiellaceae bacterium]|nr:hypothetical protein [Coxiellaceae bacterium]
MNSNNPSVKANEVSMVVRDFASVAGNMLREAHQVLSEQRHDSSRDLEAGSVRNGM